MFSPSPPPPRPDMTYAVDWALKANCLSTPLPTPYPTFIHKMLCLALLSFAVWTNTISFPRSYFSTAFPSSGLDFQVSPVLVFKCPMSGQMHAKSHQQTIALLLWKHSPEFSNKSCHVRTSNLVAHKRAIFFIIINFICGR